MYHTRRKSKEPERKSLHERNATGNSYVIHYTASSVSGERKPEVEHRPGKMSAEIRKKGMRKPIKIEIPTGLLASI